MKLHILNDDFFGYGLVPMKAENVLSQEVAQFVNVKIHNIGDLSACIIY